MKKKVKCWERFGCKEKACPSHKSNEFRCWLISGTHCRNEIQGKFLEKMEKCLACEVFRVNLDVDSTEETLTVISKQFAEYRSMVSTEIAERKRTEEALRESEERYRRITGAVTDYIFTVRIEDGHPVETVHGPACVAVTGYTPEEFASDSHGPGIEPCRRTALQPHW